MGNAGEITFFLMSYFLSVAHSNFMPMMLFYQWYLESQKPLVTLFMPKKIKNRFLIKKKSQRSCWVKKGKTEA